MRETAIKSKRGSEPMIVLLFYTHPAGSIRAYNLLKIPSWSFSAAGTLICFATNPYEKKAMTMLLRPTTLLLLALISFFASRLWSPKRSMGRKPPVVEKNDHSAIR